MSEGRRGRGLGMVRIGSSVRCDPYTVKPVPGPQMQWIVPGVVGCYGWWGWVLVRIGSSVRSDPKTVNPVPGPQMQWIGPSVAAYALPLSLVLRGGCTTSRPIAVPVYVCHCGGLAPLTNQ